MRHERLEPGGGSRLRPEALKVAAVVEDVAHDVVGRGRPRADLADVRKPTLEHRAHDAHAPRAGVHLRGDGAWVHLDYRAPRAKEFIAACAGGRWTAFKDLEVKKQTHISNLMVADPRKTQPRCEITFSENAVCTGMLLSLFDRDDRPMVQKRTLKALRWLRAADEDEFRVALASCPELDATLAERVAQP